MDRAGMEPTPEGRTGEAIRNAAEGAKEELSRLGEEVKEKSVSLFHSQRDLASRQVHSLAKALEVGADSLNEEGQGRLAEYTRDAAERVHRIGDEIRDRDFGRVFDNVNHYARENPALLIGGAAALGFLLSRFMKSSPSRPYSSSGGAEEKEERTPSTAGATRTATDIGYSAETASPISESSEPYQGASAPSSVSEEETGDTRSASEGMAPGISPIGESARVEDTRRRYGDGTES